MAEQKFPTLYPASKTKKLGRNKITAGKKWKYTIKTLLIFGPIFHRKLNRNLILFINIDNFVSISMIEQSNIKIFNLKRHTFPFFSCFLSFWFGSPGIFDFHPFLILLPFHFHFCSSFVLVGPFGFPGIFLAGVWDFARVCISLILYFVFHLAGVCISITLYFVFHLDLGFVRQVSLLGFRV